MRLLALPSELHPRILFAQPLTGERFVIIAHLRWKVNTFFRFFSKKFPASFPGYVGNCFLYQFSQPGILPQKRLILPTEAISHAPDGSDPPAAWSQFFPQAFDMGIYRADIPAAPQLFAPDHIQQLCPGQRQIPVIGHICKKIQLLASEIYGFTRQNTLALAVLDSQGAKVHIRNVFRHLTSGPA